MRIPLRRIVIEAACFAVLVVIYFAPLMLGLTEFGSVDVRVHTLLGEALKLPEVRAELARNGAAHLLLIAAFHAGLVYTSDRFAEASGLHWAVSRLCVFVVGWLALVVVNRLLFPLSDYAYALSYLAHPLTAIALLALLVAALGYAWLRSTSKTPRRGLAGAGAATLAILVTGAIATKSESTRAQGTRNVIIIGIDSLSGPVFESNRALLPNLTALLDRSMYFERAYTPLGRTFPAWMSVLSGLSPAEHGAVFNLRDVKHVERDALLTKALRQQGYRTIFAIDERRFAHIDESFGFDEVVGPKVGVLDFLLQDLNDTPLTNLILQTWLGQRALPFSYLNTASHVNYDAEAFVEHIAEAASDTAPLFMAVHFESAHFPFQSRHSKGRPEGETNVFLARHLAALTAVDAQVGDLVSRLSRKGHLDDALVIVMSDHGEGFGEIEARTTRGGEALNIVGYGHGANVLSEHQNRVILGLLQYRNGQPANEHVRRDDLVSLTDLRDVIEHFTASDQIKLDARDRCLLSETGLRFVGAANYKTLNPAELAAESAKHYEIAPDGRMRLRERSLAELIAMKDVALRCPDRLTYFSATAERYYSYSTATDTGLLESEPPGEDIARIDAYRKTLAAAAIH